MLQTALSSLLQALHRPLETSTKIIPIKTVALAEFQKEHEEANTPKKQQDALVEEELVVLDRSMFTSSLSFPRLNKKANNLLVSVFLSVKANPPSNRFQG